MKSSEGSAHWTAGLGLGRRFALATGILVALVALGSIGIALHHQRAVMRAAAGLERVGRGPEAAAAYSTILVRWPGSFAALMGLGNVWFADGDMAGAELAYRQAIDASPERAEAWNNLAYVLAAKGLRTDAVAAANEAVRLAPGNEASYLETLQEVSGG